MLSLEWGLGRVRLRVARIEEQEEGREDRLGRNGGWGRVVVPHRWCRCIELVRRWWKWKRIDGAVVVVVVSGRRRRKEVGSAAPRWGEIGSYSEECGGVVVGGVAS